MNIRIALGAALVLVLGSTAVGSATINPAQGAVAANTGHVATADVTPEMLANWKATAASADYTAPRLPI
jgi:hypothetical protein